MQNTGYKDYLRWKWFYTRRHGVEGDLGEMWESIQDYHENFHAPESYSDDSDWQFIGPFGFPLGHGNTSSRITGKGMMLSLWVSGGDHSLIYAGSHHGGLWKTNDGGDNWFPLHDNDARIHGVNSIAVDSEDYNTIYITCNNSLRGFSDYAAGLFKSIDGGDTWNQLTIPDISYPTESWASSVRKTMIHDKDPGILYFISYRNVFRSIDQGTNWDNVFFKNYNPWDLQGFKYHNGLFDFKIAPWDWDVEIAYLAGSEIFEIVNPQEGFDTINISDNIFLINPGDVMVKHPSRCEISMHENFPYKVWFCYSANYIVNGVESNYVRIVSYDKSNNSFQLILNRIDNITGADPGISGDKLEFAVSPSDPNVFYLGGILIYKVDANQIPAILISIKDLGSNYPEDCWVHDDIRDMQLLSDGAGNDTLYVADDAGISWGTPFEGGHGNCNENAWNWRHPCTSTENGLNVTEFYGIGISESEPNLVAGGCQDLGDMLLHNGTWINFGGGDGSELIWDKENPNIFYFTESQSGLFNRTNDLGNNESRFYTLDNSNLFIPMELDPLDPSILYSGAKKLLKFSGVNDFNNQVPPPDKLADFTNIITDLEVVRFGLNQRRYFVSTMKKYDYNPSPPPSSEFTDCIFFSSDGVNFHDISANLDGCRYGFISDIEVNPYDPDQIWVCATGYSKSEGNNTYQDSKVFTLRLSMPGNDWQDFSQDLPLGLPVFKIRYIPQHGLLLAATDVGIFKRNQTDTQWYPYNTNLPPAKIITDIEVNLPFNKIIAATYGRGLWETEMEDICNITEPPLYIDNHVIWTDETLLKGDIIIQNGGTLEIVKCGVFMPENARIIVWQGGTLIVDGGTITSSCQELWDGISVWGSNHFQYFSEYFGQVYLKNHAVIENARIAISNYCTDCEYPQSGGIISASDAIFRNNQIAVKFLQFTNMYLGDEWPYNASFLRCSFEFNQDKLPDAEFEYFIIMLRVNGIHFEGCDFINSVDLTGSRGEIEDKYGTGI
jgi:hypothetical protein